MNDLELLRDQVASEHPDAKLDVTQPLRPDGVWMLDIDKGLHQLSVEWRAVEGLDGFGISRVTEDSLFQMGSDYYVGGIDQAKAQIRELLAA